MTMQVGLWIDHREAVIVTLSADGVSEQVVDSKVEGHVRYSGGTGSGGRGTRAGEGEDKRERYFEGQLARFYDEVIATHSGCGRHPHLRARRSQDGAEEAYRASRARYPHRGCRDGRQDDARSNHCQGAPALCARRPVIQRVTQ